MKAQLAAAAEREALLMGQLKATATELLSTREVHELALSARAEAMRAAIDSQNLASQLEREINSSELVAAAEDDRLLGLKEELSTMRRQLTMASMMSTPGSPGDERRLRGLKKVANRHSLANSERRAKRKTKAEQRQQQRQPIIAPRVRTERQKKAAAKKNPQTFDAADLPAGWAAGKLDDGTPFWFHEDQPQNIVFKFPGAASKKKKPKKQPGAAVEDAPGSSRSADAVVAEATEVLLCHFRKHRPRKANREAVAEVILEFQLQRKFRRDWAERMYSSLREQSGEDPRDVYNDTQAVLAMQLAQEQQQQQQKEAQQDEQQQQEQLEQQQEQQQEDLQQEQQEQQEQDDEGGEQANAKE